MNRLISFLLLLTFFASGCAALIYQLVWQRYLFTGLGVDIDSVTLIVSTFMLGIGLGGALGGWLADNYSEHRIYVYAVAELLLCLIGFASPVLFSWLPLLGAGGLSYTLISLIAMLVLLVPTAVMGTTLPILTMEFDAKLSNIGVSVGMLYFFNTLGAAFGAWVTGNVLFMTWGLNASAWIAATINLTCFVCALVAAKLTGGASVMPAAMNKAST